MAAIPQLHDDPDPEEIQEWLEALDAVIDNEGPERAHFILEKLVEKGRRRCGHLPFKATTGYINTIPRHLEARPPEYRDHHLEWRIRSLVRWNAIAMVVNANRQNDGIGGHIASYASACTLYEIGFNHFWRAPNAEQDGDMVFIQGHSAPGIYARAFLEGRLSEEQISNFRRDVDGQGVSSYPHPWLMPDFWQFPTVSMGLGPIQAVQQARFMRYMHDRGIRDTSGRKVWAFMGDGEMDEPESLGSIDTAARENLDNLIFVVNCNLQRLDGPVRGNSKIIQELEGEFRGAGWNVIKVIWGSRWDPLLEMDHTGLLQQRMEECVDGEYQAFKARGGDYTRKHFFAKYPELEQMVAGMSDYDIYRLNRGGHDPHKVYAAYHAAVNHTGQPTVILAKTVKGYGMGEAGEGQNITHQQKKMGESALRKFRDHYEIPIPDEQLKETPFYKPDDDAPEIRYLHERRRALGGYLPQRVQRAPALEVPQLDTFKALLEGSGDREQSTTMAFVRALTALTRDKNVGQNIVPIVPDEARTFGMEGLFRQLGIYSSVGQLYEPEDADQLMFYKEDKKGQILEEGIDEAGAMSTWIAAATAYANHGVNMVPFYIFYSMFGFQRVGDLIWAAGDIQARGFLMGGTAGRTTLNGEGLQHQDGHSHLLASAIPNCISYDPAFAYELAVILQGGMQRMFADQDNVFFYITIYNENYPQPALPQGVEEGILRGMYCFSHGDAASDAPRVQLLGSGSIMREVMAAAQLLEDDWGVQADIWSCPSFTELARDGMSCQRQQRLHGASKAARPYIEQCLADYTGPAVAATDYVRAYAEQVRPYIDRPYWVLGTDGFGRSDTRESLRRFFEVDRYQITTTALWALAEQGEIDAAKVGQAVKEYGLATDAANPWEV
ncbi:pyruvate dehydrogenase (acetyl-transferring), homodimeric type [Halorhodospira halochloris]|uniref:Pyruvate dehydrogenase E1 component n=1 Tax=Halorhodospira halochloris TaxID=1052 RepID=A0A110B4J4_HALHR|nr:pyruvate dehydrogenase (acetyl-transferring), homodimeric type [Halorhodospira halochloris]MBK1650961.1 pyruvate dehydrogenase (acetyl-transferring), homodimeric type [Halorhodospira halochloris]MCG5529327.1 pyruvate dehydrogenase (acetyl-transferring), homodimeric type [Halorhodospira halochloris]BAU56533.1 pyruvate dehydrogenase E1 component [Halorhodospira halochloris]